MKNLVVAFLVCFAFNGLNAQLSLGKMFSDNMVLQRDKPIHIFGKALPTVRQAKKQKSARFL